MMNLFERATRANYTFASSKGDLTLGQLWKLHLTSTRGPSLQSVAVGLNRQINDLGEDMFVSTASTSKGAKLLKDKLEVVKRIIEVRETESKASNLAIKKAAEKERLLNALAEREQEDIKSLSAEELKKRLEAL